ncbi:MAG: hypothetical protein VB140_09855 [Burkholderia sp.]
MLVRNPFVSPEIMPAIPLPPHTRFMQQRPFSLKFFPLCNRIFSELIGRSAGLGGVA